jgi:hypothetical protein
VRCQAQKKWKLVVVQAGDWSKLLCNGCDGLLQSKKGDLDLGLIERLAKQSM